MGLVVDTEETTMLKLNNQLGRVVGTQTSQSCYYLIDCKLLKVELFINITNAESVWCDKIAMCVGGKEIKANLEKLLWKLCFFLNFGNQKCEYNYTFTPFVKLTFLLLNLVNLNHSDNLP